MESFKFYGNCLLIAVITVLLCDSVVSDFSVFSDSIHTGIIGETGGLIHSSCLKNPRISASAVFCPICFISYV